jgi:mono/diheme cytochrome c family protein
MSNKNYIVLGIIVVLLAFILVACDKNSGAGANTNTNTNTQTLPMDFSSSKAKEQIAHGETIFRANCASCHGVNAQGAFNWRQVGPDGKYPPPPLNGSGHAWHHPTKVLRQVIKYGSPGGQGNMPPWKDRLTDQEIDYVIVWFQSKWSPQVYQAWLERDRNSGFQRVN